MAKKFDLSALMAEGKVPDLAVKDLREQIEYIHIDRIDDDPANFYALSGLEELAENIEFIGLQQPLRVRKDGERFVLVSGHRRRAAIRLLVESGRDDLAEIPCILEGDAGSTALQELRLIYANSDTRKLSSADLSRQAERVEILLYQLKEEGYEFPGRMRDHVAAACKVSGPKLARLKVIRENLGADFREAFEDGKLPEQTAYALARLPEDFQRRIFRVYPLKDLHGGYMENVTKLYLEGCRWEPCMTCPDGKECRHGDSALRHDLESYNACGGNKCCLDCREAKEAYGSCIRACSKVKARKAEKTAEEKASQEERRLERQTEYEAKTQANAKRLLPAIEAAGIADNVRIQWTDYDYTTTAGHVRRWAAGKFDKGLNWCEPQLEVYRLKCALTLAKQLGCSADFLLGLSDELRPGGVQPVQGWIPGTQHPNRPMEVVARFDLGGGLMHRIFARWSGTEWTFKNGESVDSPVVDWFPLPEEG